MMDFSRLTLLFLSAFIVKLKETGDSNENYIIQEITEVFKDRWKCVHSKNI